MGKKPVPETRSDESEAGLHSRIAGLEMDLRERDQRIAEMQKEYIALETARDKASTGGAHAQMEKLFKKLSANLSNLAALADMAETGQEIESRDMVQLIRALEKDLKAVGLERIGRVGEACSFEVSLHQRMSGGSVHAGTPVRVRIPGYQYGEKILLKALVTTQEVHHE